MDLKTACYCTACKQGTFQALQDLIAHVYYGEQERYTGIYYTIEQFSYKQLTNAAFSHVLGLLMEFHSEQDTAEVMKAIEQGAALTNVLEIAFLEIAPAIIDLFVAVFLFRVKFNSLAALCVLIATPSFLALEVSASSWNVYNRRQLTKVERGEARVMHQAIQGSLTVSSFNMFTYEKYRFAEAVDKHMTAKQRWSLSRCLLDWIDGGVLPGCFCRTCVSRRQ